jgi:cell division protein FtsQ
MSSPRLTVKKIDIQGTRVRSADTLAAESGIKAGDNIFRVEPDACRRALLRDPWLSEVVITRDLPSTIRIVVKERQATLMVALERVYLATAAGQIFKPFEATDPQELPLVVGLTTDQFVRDRAGAERLIRQASELTAAYADSVLDRKYPLQEIHFAPDEAISIVIGKDGLTLRLGGAPFRRKLARAARVIDETERRSNRADLVLLDNDARADRVVVRMR